MKRSTVSLKKKLNLGKKKEGKTQLDAVCRGRIHAKKVYAYNIRRVHITLMNIVKPGFGPKSGRENAKESRNVGSDWEKVDQWTVLSCSVDVGKDAIGITRPPYVDALKEVAAIAKATGKTCTVYQAKSEKTLESLAADCDITAFSNQVSKLQKYGSEMDFWKNEVMHCKKLEELECMEQQLKKSIALFDQQADKVIMELNQHPLVVHKHRQALGRQLKDDYTYHFVLSARCSSIAASFRVLAR